MEAFALKWFIIYYFSIAALFTIQGLIWLFQPGAIAEKTKLFIQSDKAPQKALKVIKYLFLFNLISSVLSFFPINFLHLAFCAWVFLMVFISGRFFLNWKSFCELWKNNVSGLPRFFQRTGALFFAIGLATSMLMYYVTDKIL